MRTLCLGEALVDLVCERPVDSPAQAETFVPRFGGAVANVAVSAARRGADVALAGGAGDDAWGEWLRARLVAEGVGLDWFRLVEGLSTPVAFVTVDARGEPSFSIYGEGIGTVVGAVGPWLGEAVDACDALFFASNTLVGEEERELTLATRERALAAGRPVVFDPNVRPGRWASAGECARVAAGCVAGCALVKCNRSEAALLTGEDDPASAARELLALGAGQVVVTLGAGGALLRGGGLDRDVPGVPAEVVDATGAGDVLMGVLLARFAASGFYPPAIAAALPEAVAAAARTTEHWGAIR